MAKIESATRCSQSVLFYFCFALSLSLTLSLVQFFENYVFAMCTMCLCLWMFESCATHSIEPNANWYHLRMYNVLVYLLNATLFPSANSNHNSELLDHGNCLSHSNTITQHSSLHTRSFASSIFQCSHIESVLAFYLIRIRKIICDTSICVCVCVYCVFASPWNDIKRYAASIPKDYFGTKMPTISNKCKQKQSKMSEKIAIEMERERNDNWMCTAAGREIEKEHVSVEWKRWDNFTLI